MDAGDMEAVYRFCRRFLPVLEEVGREYPSDFGRGPRSQVTLRLQNESLEAIYNGSRVFKGESASVIAYMDSQLEAGIQLRNCWAKRLPRSQLVQTLRRHKNHLQTVGLLCGEEERAALSDLLLRIDVVRVTMADSMSCAYPGEAHDGEYSLRRYTKIASWE